MATTKTTKTTARKPAVKTAAAPAKTAKTKAKAPALVKTKPAAKVPTPAKAKATKPAQARKPAAAKTPAPAQAAAPAKGITKKMQALALLTREEGVSGKELSAALGWQAHTTRGFLSILSKTMQVETMSRSKETGTIYRVAVDD